MITIIKKKEVSYIFIAEKIYHLSIALNKYLDMEFKYTGLHFGQIQTLLMLFELTQNGNKKVSQEELTKKMYVDKSNVSRNVQKLLSKGYIQAEQDKLTGRKQLFFNEENKIQMQQYFVQLAKMLKIMLYEIDLEELKSTEVTMDKMLRNLEFKNQNETS